MNVSDSVAVVVVGDSTSERRVQAAPPVTRRAPHEPKGITRPPSPKRAKNEKTLKAATAALFVCFVRAGLNPRVDLCRRRKFNQWADLNASRTLPNGTMYSYGLTVFYDGTCNGQVLHWTQEAPAGKDDDGGLWLTDSFVSANVEELLAWGGPFPSETA